MLPNQGQLCKVGAKYFELWVKCTAIVWGTSVCWQVHYTFFLRLWKVAFTFFPCRLLTSPSFILPSVALAPSVHLSKQASRQSVQSSLIIALLTWVSGVPTFPVCPEPCCIVFLIHSFPRSLPPFLFFIFYFNGRFLMVIFPNKRWCFQERWDKTQENRDFLWINNKRLHDLKATKGNSTIILV